MNRDSRLSPSSRLPVCLQIVLKTFALSVFPFPLPPPPPFFPFVTRAENVQERGSWADAIFLFSLGITIQTFEGYFVSIPDVPLASPVCLDSLSLVFLATTSLLGSSPPPLPSPQPQQLQLQPIQFHPATSRTKMQSNAMSPLVFQRPLHDLRLVHSGVGNRHSFIEFVRTALGVFSHSLRSLHIQDASWGHCLSPYVSLLSPIELAGTSDAL
jgi:hypothetical protein